METHEPPPSSNDAILSETVAQSELPHDTGEDVAQWDQPRREHIINTGYVGSTHWSAILDDIHELKAVLGGSSEVQEAQELIEPKATASGREPIFGLSNDYSTQQIISRYLPSRVEVDRFLSIYFRGETFILPFIHSNHFQRQYRDFWADTEKVNPLWLSILFSICYVASLIGGETVPYHSSQNGLVTDRSILHVAAGQCLVAGEYHLPQLFTVEALMMYAHCKNLRSLDPSREAGAILGLVVRMAYEMGYHRDPDSVGSFTIFEGEMRRRFWAVCKQMDLMVSFMLGLPSNICLEDCDTKSPRNLLDSDFDVGTQTLPAPRSENEVTNLLWFIVKDGQMISFSKVCQDALSFTEKSEVEILQLDKEVRKMHSTVPDVLRARPLSESITDSPFLIITRLYVEFISLKSLCVLHRRYMTRGNIFSTRSCVEAGKSLVSSFIDMYKEFSPGGQLHAERWMLGNFTMNDFLLGVMVLCLVVHIRWKRGSQNSAIDATTESEVVALLEQSHAICVEKSTTSRDARRVSHAIRLTLNEAKPSSLPNMSSRPFLAPPATTLGVQPVAGEKREMDPTSLLLHSPYNYTQGYEAAFGLLDPFNFMGNDIESIDWTAFDPQNLEQDASNME